MRDTFGLYQIQTNNDEPLAFRVGMFVCLPVWFCAKFAINLIPLISIVVMNQNQDKLLCKIENWLAICQILFQILWIFGLMNLFYYYYYFLYYTTLAHSSSSYSSLPIHKIREQYYFVLENIVIGQF